MVNEESFYDKHNKYLLTKKRHFIYRLLTIIVLWSAVIVYFAMPISKTRNIEIKGNVFITNQQILEMADISKKTLRIDVSNKEIEKKLNKHKLIEKTNSKITLNKSSISVYEIYPIGKNDDRFLWSNGDYTNNIDIEFYGYIPVIEATINASFIDDFSIGTKGFAALRKNKNLLSISNALNYPLANKNAYVLTFNETINNQLITLEFVIDTASVPKKLTLDFYNQIVDEISLNPINIVDNKVTIGYTESSYSYWRI